MPRAVGKTGRSISFKVAFFFAWAALGYGQLCAGWPRHCPPPHAAFRTRCPPTVQHVRSEAHYAAAVLRLVRPASGGEPGKTGESAALPHWAEAKPEPPHVVRIRTDIFLRRGKCPGCRVRWGETGRSISFKGAFFFAWAALGYGQLCAVWPRPCLPPHAAFRTRCTPTVQRVRSEAHYAAAVPRLVQLSSDGGPCKTGERAALFLLCPRRRPPCPLGGAVLK